MKQMKKIIKLCKEKYKILIPIMVVLVLIITMYFLYRGYKYDNTRNKKEIPVFQYFAGVRVDYDAIITYNLKDAIVEIEAKNKKVNFDSTPIYYKNMKNIIFPEEMTIAFPLKQGLQYKLYKYATYYKLDDVDFIKNYRDTGNYSNFFLYDGKDLFFFPNETILMIDNKEYKKLGAMSFVRIVGGYTLVYYDTETGTSDLIELKNENVSITSEFINVNLTERYFMSFGNKVLLFTPNNLDPVFKTIDK